MRTVEAHEARKQLSRLLEDVARGETITITKHGVPVARLVPLEIHRTTDVREVVAAIPDFGRGRLLGKASIRDLIDEGRRF